MLLKVKVGNKSSEVRLPENARAGQRIKFKINVKNPGYVDVDDVSALKRTLTPSGDYVQRKRIETESPRNAVDMRNRIREEATRTYQTVVQRTGADPAKEYFSSWTKWELCELLVLYGVELRNERRLKCSKLKAACVHLFKGDVEAGQGPEKPEPPSFETLMFMNKIALRIQRSWTIRQMEKHQAAMLLEAENDAYLRRPHSERPDDSGMDSAAGAESYTNYRKEMQEDSEEQPGPGARNQPARDIEAGGQSKNEREKSNEEKWLSKPWVLPNFLGKDSVKTFKDRNHPRVGGRGGNQYSWRASAGRHCTLKGWGEQLDLWDEGKVSEFSQFGPGVVLYFKLLKFLYWIFVVISVMFIPLITINSYGEGISDPSGLSSLALLTVGNLGNPSNITQLRVPGCSQFNYLLSDLLLDTTDCVIDKTAIGTIYSVIDVLAVVLLLAGIMWLRYYEVEEIDDLDRNTVSPGDFTLMVPWVPAATTEENLAAFFNRDGKKVEIIHFAYDDGDLIEAYTKRAKLVFDKYLTGQQIRYYRSQLLALGESVDDEEEGKCCGALQNAAALYCSRGYNRVKERMLLRTRDEISAEMELLDSQVEASEAHKNTWKRPLCAFVSFSEESHMLQAVTESKRSIFRRIFNACGLCLSEKQAFLNRYALNCTIAPAPSTIIWENIKYSRFERIKRLLQTTGVALASIFLSVLASAFTENYKYQASSDETMLCPDGFEDWSVEEQQEFVQRQGDDDEAPNYTHCYCTQYTYEEQAQDSICRSFNIETTRVFFLQLFAVFMVSATNVFITYLMNKMARSYEKHPSMDGIEASVFIRVFFLKLLSTGFQYLILNLSFITALAGPNGLDEDFSIEWYANVAPLVITLMASNIIAPHMPILLRFIKQWRRQRRLEIHGVQGVEAVRKSDGLFCQEQLNDLYLGPEFHLHIRYAQALVVFYVCMMYGLGIPILMPIGACHFFVTFWFDKIMFIRYYRVPPYYDHTISVRASGLLVYGVLLHLLGGIWMLSNGAVFADDSVYESAAEAQEYTEEFEKSGVYSRLTQLHVMPLTVMAILMICALLAHFVVGNSFTLLGKILHVVTCHKTTTVKREAALNAVSVSYGQALRRGIIKGLPTYNVLLNPVYREAFKVDPKWVIKGKHKHVSSVRQFNLEAFSDPGQVKPPDFV